MNLEFFKKAVMVTAVVNILAGASALIAIDLHMNLFYGRTTIDPLFKLYHYNFWFAVMLMGIGYYYLALNPTENRVFALVGGLMKLMIAITWLILLQMDVAKVFVLGPVTFDLFYGILLCYFFYKFREKKKINS